MTGGVILFASCSSRLHIPIAFWEESLHSSVPGGTVFPTPVLQGNKVDSCVTST